jgi:hypothetical protein
MKNPPDQGMSEFETSDELWRLAAEKQGRRPAIEWPINASRPLLACALVAAVNLSLAPSRTGGWVILLE